MLPFLEAMLLSSLNDWDAWNSFLGLSANSLRESLEVQCWGRPSLLAGRNLQSELRAAVQATPGQCLWEMGGALIFLPLALLWFSHSELLRG